MKSLQKLIQPLREQKEKRERKRRRIEARARVLLGKRSLQSVIFDNTIYTTAEAEDFLFDYLPQGFKIFKYHAAPNNHWYELVDSNKFKNLLPKNVANMPGVGTLMGKRLWLQEWFGLK